MDCQSCLFWKRRHKALGECFVADDRRTTNEEMACHKWKQKVTFHAVGDIAEKLFPRGVKKW
jgi:hypothetical protein